MAKSILPTLEKWTVDEKRLLVLFLLVVIYPVFVSSFFALYTLVIIPEMETDGIPLTRLADIYWFAVTFFWVFLCALILPCFKKKPMIEWINNESLSCPPTRVKVEEKEDTQNNLSKGSEDSSEDLKKTNDSESERENSEEIKENLGKSYESLNRMKITQSGEFLNDFITTTKSEDGKNETVCEVHVEGSKESENGTPTRDFEHQRRGSSKDMESGRESKNYESDNESKKDEDSERKIKNVNTEELADKTTDNISHSSDSSNDVEPSISPQEAKSALASPLKVDEHQEGTVESEMEEVDQLDENSKPYKRIKPIPSIDTSRASGYYECSMPTPRSLERQNSQNNTVFLFISPETANTEESIKVSHGENLDNSAN